MQIRLANVQLQTFIAFQTSVEYFKIGNTTQIRAGQQRVVDHGRHVNVSLAHHDGSTLRKHVR